MTFKEWEAVIETEYTCEFGRYGNPCIRDIYTTPPGVKVHDEVIMPRSIFKPPYKRTLVDLIYPVTELPRLRETYGDVDLDCDRYTEKGFGYPLFIGEGSLELAYNFIEKEKALR